MYGDASRSNQDGDVGVVGEIAVGEIATTACVEVAVGRVGAGERGGELLVVADADADSK